ATGAGVDAGLLVIQQRAAERTLGSFRSQDAELLGREPRAPLFVRKLHLRRIDRTDQLTLVIEHMHLHHGLFLVSLISSWQPIIRELPRGRSGAGRKPPRNTGCGRRPRVATARLAGRASVQPTTWLRPAFLAA